MAMLKQITIQRTVQSLNTTMRWWKRTRRRKKNISKEQIFVFSLCWIVLFDPECSERRALCNVLSTHMADCVTAKHTGGVEWWWWGDVAEEEGGGG